MKEHLETKAALKKAQNALLVSEQDAKKAAAQRIQELETALAKMQKKEVESDKLLTQLREAKLMVERERDALQQELGGLRKSASNVAKLQDSITSLHHQLAEAKTKLQDNVGERDSFRKTALELKTKLSHLEAERYKEEVAQKSKIEAEMNKWEAEKGKWEMEKSKLLAGPCIRCKGKDFKQQLMPPPAPVTKPPASVAPSKPQQSPRKEMTHKEVTKGAPLSARGVPKLVGVGVRLTDMYPHCVAEFVRDGAAHRSGKIQAGDHLLKVDGEDIQKLHISQIAAKIVGLEGSLLHLSFRRGHGADAQEFEVELVRGNSTGNATS